MKHACTWNVTVSNEICVLACVSWVSRKVGPLRALHVHDRQVLHGLSGASHRCECSPYLLHFLLCFDSICYLLIHVDRIDLSVVGIIIRHWNRSDKELVYTYFNWFSYYSLHFAYPKIPEISDLRTLKHKWARVPG